MGKADDDIKWTGIPVICCFRNLSSSHCICHTSVPYDSSAIDGRKASCLRMPGQESSLETMVLS